MKTSKSIIVRFGLPWFGWCLLLPQAPAAQSDQAPAFSPDNRAAARVQAPPLGLPPVVVPSDNPATPERIALGRKLFFDQAVESVGTPQDPDLGRFEITLKPEDRQKFKTPSLRNVAVTAPYMHDGSMQTLLEVVRYYSRGGEAHAGLDPLVHPLGLTSRHEHDLVAFLESLTSSDLTELIDDARSVEVGN